MQRVGEIQLTNHKPEPTLTVRPPAERLQHCLALLLGLGEMRQTTLSAETQTVYAAILAQYDPGHVASVLMRLGRTARGEYEKAIPELGDLEAMVKQEEKAARPKFVPCGKCINGYIFVNDAGMPWNWRLDCVADRRVRECNCRREWKEKT